MWLNKNDNMVIKKPIAVVVNGVQHPSTIFSKWSEAELNTIGVYTPTIDAVPNRRYYTYNEVVDFTTNRIVRTPIDKPLADVKALMIKSLEETANQKFTEATSGYTPSEMSSWYEMEAQALAHQTTPLTSGMLFDEAQIAGITVDALATKVLTNATTLKQYKSYIAGMRQKKSLEINALTSVAQCVDYENFTYDYTITAEDVLLDDTLVEGAVVQRVGNKVTDWSI